MPILREVLINRLSIILALFTDPRFRPSFKTRFWHRGKEILALAFAGAVVAVRHLVLGGVFLRPSGRVRGECIVPF